MKIAGREIKTKVLVIAAGLLVFAVAGFSCYKYYAQKSAEEAQAKVHTVTVTRKNLVSTVSATGTIMPVDSVEVSSKITARIKSVLVKENEHVKAGQTVAVLDGKDYEAERDQAQYKVTNTKSAYNRMAYLHSIGAKSDQDLENAEYNYQTAQTSLDKTQSDVSETIITAPMDGVVVGEPLTAGTMAVQGNSNPTVIMRIANLSKKKIKAKVDETDIGNVKVGQQATFTVDAYNGKTFSATVSKISQTDVSNSWDTQSSSSSSSSSSSASVIYYYVTLEVDDPENILLPAMTARVEIETASHDNALSIPISALKTNSEGSYVVVKTADGSKENRRVTTGIYSDEDVEIVEGLQEGDVLIVEYKTTSSSSGTKMRGGPPM